MERGSIVRQGLAVARRLDLESTLRLRGRPRVRSLPQTDNKDSCHIGFALILYVDDAGFSNRYYPTFLEDLTGRERGVLSDGEINQFHDSMLAAKAAGVPLPWSRLKVNFNDQRVRRQVNNGWVAEEVLSRDSLLPIRYLTALTVFSRTNSFDLVLDGLTRSKLARRELARIIRAPLFYLVAVLFAATVLLSFFSEFIAVEILRLRTDLSLLPAVTSQHPDTMQWIPNLMIGLALVESIFFYVLLFGGSAHLAWFLGGRGYQTNLEAATVLRVANRLLANSVPVDHAMKLAGDLVNAGVTARNQVRTAIHKPNADATQATDFDVIADDFDSAADSRLMKLRILLPIIFVSLIGGSAVMAYSVAVFWPIIALIKDLSLPGVQT